MHRAKVRIWYLQRVWLIKLGFHLWKKRFGRGRELKKRASKEGERELQERKFHESLRLKGPKEGVARERELEMSL